MSSRRPGQGWIGALPLFPGREFQEARLVRMRQDADGDGVSDGDRRRRI